MNIFHSIRSHYKKQNTTVVYTAIYGNYDDLKDPPVGIIGCDFVCFTDNPNLTSSTYKIIYHRGLFKDKNRNAKIFKILPHVFLSQYKYSLWVDGSVVIKNINIQKLVATYLADSDIALFKHPDRDCIYDEMDVCLALKKDDPAVMKQQINNYRSNKYPEHNGLAACTVILRRHTTNVMVRIAEDWWEEIAKHSKRDQLSFNYVLWKNKSSWNIIEGLLWENEYFKVLNHKK